MIRRTLRRLRELPPLRALGRRRAQPGSSAVPPGDYGVWPSATEVLASLDPALRRYVVSVQCARKGGKVRLIEHAASEAERQGMRVLMVDSESFDAEAYAAYALDRWNAAELYRRHLKEFYPSIDVRIWDDRPR